jgi:hypothetical protein
MLDKQNRVSIITSLVVLAALTTISFIKFKKKDAQVSKIEEESVV